MLGGFIYYHSIVGIFPGWIAGWFVRDWVPVRVLGCNIGSDNDDSREGWREACRSLLKIPRVVVVVMVS